MLEGFFFAASFAFCMLADKHTRKEKIKNNEGKQRKNTNGNMQSVTT
jgi:hypothetical protein